MNTTPYTAAPTTHIRSLMRDMRHALAEYQKFDARWNNLNDMLNEKFKAEGRDVLEISRAKEANVTLQGHMSAATWWRDKAQALGTIILAEKAAHEMLRNM